MKKERRGHGRLSREQKEATATRKSVRTASEISFSTDEEMRLLELLARMDNVILQEDAPPVAVKRTEASYWNASSDSSGESGNELGSSSESESDDEALAPQNVSAAPQVMTRTAFARKLVRDDRFDRKSYRDNHSQASEVVAARIRHAIKAATARKDEPTSAVGPAPTMQGSRHPTLSPAETKVAAATLKKTIRVTVACAGAKSKAAKLVVIDRDSTISDLLKGFRAKCSVGAKYDAIIIVSTQKLLDAFDLLDLRDGEALHIVQLSALSAPSSNERSSIALVRPASPGPSPPQPAPPAVLCSPSTSTMPLPVAIQRSAPAPTPDPCPPMSTKADKTFEVAPITADPVTSRKMKERWLKATGSAAYQVTRAQRQSLPIHAAKDQLLNAIGANQVVVVSGETGSGKSTQLPLYLLEELIMKDCGAECSIICTQPRRIAAINLAERVAYESGEAPLGSGNVGYQIRLDARMSPSTRLLYCTTGILLQRLQSPACLTSVSHIILDEVHERGVETDFLLAIVKQRLAEYPALRVILMSATMQEQRFSDYFGGCPVVHVSGRTFPVQLHYLDEARLVTKAGRALSADSVSPSKKMGPKPRAVDELTLDKFDPQLVADLVSYIIRHGAKFSPEATNNVPDSRLRGQAILIFLSGIQAIQATAKALSAKSEIWRHPVQLHKLHSMLPPEQQRSVFRSTLPGEWKIVLCTNIAETSITVDDVTHVIDSGLMKEHRYDPRSGISALKETFVSRSSAKQRAGRAGRVRPGHCWRLYSEAYFTSPSVVDDPLPEIQRVALEEVVLQVLLRGLGAPREFLGLCLQPPSVLQLHDAIACLIEIKAVLPQASLPLTALGYHLARMPIDVRLAKMLIYACLLDCVEPALTVAAALSGKSPLAQPRDRDRERARSAHLRLLPPSPVAPSDHLVMVAAYDRWRAAQVSGGKEAAWRVCQESFLSSSVLQDMKALREHYRRYLITAGFLSSANGDADASGLEADVGLPEEGEEEAADADATAEDGEGDHLVAEITQLHPSQAPCRGLDADADLLRCALSAGLFPRVVRALRVVVEGRESIKIVQADHSSVHLHPSCLLSSCRSRLVGENTNDAFVVHFLKTANDQNQIQVFDGTVVPHLSLLMFGTSEIQAHARKGQHKMRSSVRVERALRVHVQGWMEMDLSELHLACVRRVQREVEAVLQHKVRHIRDECWLREKQECQRKQALLAAMVKILLRSE